MELTKEQEKFLDEVCTHHSGNVSWNLNRYGNVDVKGNVSMRHNNLSEIPVPFGRVEGYFDCSYNQLTTLKNLPKYIGGSFNCSYNQLTTLKTPYLRFGTSHRYSSFFISNGYEFKGNPLTDYFKDIKRRDFKHWWRLNWDDVLEEYPFLINFAKYELHKYNLKNYLNKYPQTKLYYKG